MLWNAALAILLSFMVGGCCGESVGGVGVSLHYPGSSDIEFLTVGDTLTVWAGADTGPEWPSCMLYVSRATPGFTWPVEPERFVFHSSDTTVAAFGANGFLTARGVGETILTASVGSVTNRGLLLKVTDAVSLVGRD